MKIDRYAIQALAMLALGSVSLPGGRHNGRFLVSAQEAINLLDMDQGMMMGGGEEDEDEDIVPKGQEEVREDTFEVPETAESFKFEAEVSRMLDIVVNSLYQNKDVFLRELISNASDALDKMRFLALTKPEWMQGEGADELKVEIEFDPKDQTLIVRDTGIGMTHDEMIENLGTVARSGTTKFLQALKEQGKESESGDVSQIGQFGVGFYSAFLVADRVQVASKHPNSDKQFMWTTTNGASDFNIFPDPRGSTLVRGTEIKLFLKPNASEYTDQEKIREMAKHYSEFIMHPIHLRTIETSEVEVEDEEEEKKDDEAKEDDAEKEDDADKDEDDLEVKEDDEDAEEEEKPKKYKEVTTYDWDLINGNPAIWTRPKEEITDDDYEAFYKVISKQEMTNSSAKVHFNAEGNINFKSILYLPSELPESYKHGHIEDTNGISLYVRKVLISDEFKLLPRYLNFLKGVVDSDDLPLNVNRETLQESKIIKIIRKKLVRKAVDMIKGLAKDSDAEIAEYEEKQKAKAEKKEEDKDDEADEEEEEEDSEPPVNKYIEWYKQFSPSVKMGIMEDSPNQKRLMKLLRFRSSKSDGKWISLDSYLENMKDWQKDIYTLSGMNIESVQKSQFLEPFHDKGVEVLYFVDPVDEYVFSGHVRDYEGKKFVDISKESVKFDDEDKDLVARREKYYKKMFKPLTKWLKDIYGPSVMRVMISKRLGSAPAIASSSSYGHSANMERIMRAQAYTHGQQEESVKAMRILEINPRHPLVLKLLDNCPPEEVPEGEEKKEVPEDVIDSAWILHEMALLNGGFPLTDPAGHTKRMTKFLQNSLGVESLKLADEVDPPEEPEEAPEEAIDMDDDAEEIDMDDMGGFDMDEIMNADVDPDADADAAAEGETPEPLDESDPKVEL